MISLSNKTNIILNISSKHIIIINFCKGTIVKQIIILEIC
jgi:hypothetical protein